MDWNVVRLAPFLLENFVGNITDCHRKDTKPVAKHLYMDLTGPKEVKSWKNVVIKNPATPRAVFVTWMDENIHHLFYECDVTKDIWRKILIWAGLDHQVRSFDEEVKWIEKEQASKSCFLRIFVCNLAS